VNGEILNAMARLGGQYAQMGILPRGQDDDEPPHDPLCVDKLGHPHDNECECWCHGEEW
jgi:hypothetical protein